MEHRRGRRRDTDVAVRFVALPATIGSGRITNISLTGAFMETACRLPLRAVIHIEGLDSRKERGANRHAKRLAAKVVRRCSAGVGLEWCAPYVHADADPPADADKQPEAEPQGSPAIDAERYQYHLQFID